MESSSPLEMVRQNLLDRLLNCVKQVQVHFGANQEIATESDARVSTLCIEWEMVLSHGAKKPKPKNALRLTGRSEGCVSLWPLAKLCVSIEDLQRFSRLIHVTSELGLGRAWLRAAINERTLENYIHGILAHEEQLRKFYEGHAFLLDQERSSMLPIIAAGLSSIIFSIPTDATYLNTPTHSIEVPPAVPPVITTYPPPSPPPPPSSSLSPTHSHLTPINSSRDPMLTHLVKSSDENKRKDDYDDDVIAISDKGPKKRKKKSKSKSPQVHHHHSSPPPPSSGLPLALYNNMMKESPAVPNVTEEKSTLHDSHSSSSSRLSLDSFNDEGQTPMYVALVPSSTDDINSEVVAAVNATALVLSAISSPLACDDGGNKPLEEEKQQEDDESFSRDVNNELMSETDNTFKVMQNQSSTSPQDDQMRTSIVTLSKMKDELQSRNSELIKNVSELEANCKELGNKLDESRQEMDDIRESHLRQKQALERENDLLREQLKKYVNMVQVQRRENIVHKFESLTSSSSVGDGVGEADMSDTLPQDQALTLSERKLQEVADMYGELMEHNERLHRNLADKDMTICALVRSLRDASIELPVSHQQLPSAAMETNIKLVNVWIPSVIRKGRGPEAFHVYQVFVCVKAVEWNIYRRYAEFRDFHLQLQKYLPEVATFHFPPKKAIGNKSSQVVEERRLRLQQYIRDVIKACTVTLSPAKGQRTEPIISPSISKQSFVTMFPFFKEDFNMDPPPPQSPSYSGL